MAEEGGGGDGDAIDAIDALAWMNEPSPGGPTPVKRSPGRWRRRCRVAVDDAPGAGGGAPPGARGDLSTSTRFGGRGEFKRKAGRPSLLSRACRCLPCGCVSGAFGTLDEEEEGGVEFPPPGQMSTAELNGAPHDISRDPDVA